MTKTELREKIFRAMIEPLGEDMTLEWMQNHYPDSWDNTLIITNLIWPEIESRDERIKNLEEAYPDNEADGVVFCGKCGSIKTHKI